MLDMVPTYIASGVVLRYVVMYCSSLDTPQVVQRSNMTLIWGWLKEGCDGCDWVDVPQSLPDFSKHKTDCSLDDPPLLAGE